MTTTRSERRRLAPAERREQIIDAAAAYFAECGLDGGTRELSKRMGVTQSLIFNYFDTKADLLEAVYNRVYLDRISPGWSGLLADRSRPLRDRLVQFYLEYGKAIFTYEWMRIFMYSGLAGTALNRRYLTHIRAVALDSILTEVRAAAPEGAVLDIEDIWNLHGGIVYLGIRRFVYQMPTPDDDTDAIIRAVDRFLGAYGLQRGAEQAPG